MIRRLIILLLIVGCGDDGEVSYDFIGSWELCCVDSYAVLTFNKDGTASEIGGGYEDYDWKFYWRTKDNNSLDSLISYERDGVESNELQWKVEFYQIIQDSLHIEYGGFPIRTFIKQ